MNAQENDESLLIDFCLGKLDAMTASAVRQRIGRDDEFRSLHQNIARSFQALNLLPEPEAPADLVRRTMARIHQARQTDALIAREEIGRGVRSPTFSLREAAVMVASLLIVAFLFIPSLRYGRVRQQVNQCASNIGQIGSAIQSYANENNQRLPTVGGHDLRWLPGQDRATSNSAALFKLVSGNYAPASLFACPAATGGRTFRVAPGMTDFPDATTIHYSYQHAIGHELSFNDPALAGVKAQMVILGDSTPLYRDGGFDAQGAQQAGTASSENHNRTGQNVLYLDMHVRWVKVPTAGVDGNNIYIAEGIYNRYRGDETPNGPTDTFLMPAYTPGK
jgi:lipoprotein-anchoring transpeptidase ErfK/SrfK